MAKARTRRQFTREFKLEVVRLVAAGDRSLNQEARDLGVRPDMLRQWRRQADGQHDPPRERSGDGPGGRPTLMGQDEVIRRLRRELALVREERDIPGQATAFSAKGLRRHTSSPRAHRAAHAVTTLYRVLGGSKAGYYARATRGLSMRVVEDRVLAVAIRAAHQDSARTYGSPRVQRGLRD